MLGDRPTFAEIQRELEAWGITAHGVRGSRWMWCLAPLEPSKTKPRVFCSDSCRKRVSRATVERAAEMQVRVCQMWRALDYTGSLTSAISEEAQAS